MFHSPMTSNAGNDESNRNPLTVGPEEVSYRTILDLFLKKKKLTLPKQPESCPEATKSSGSIEFRAPEPRRISRLETLPQNPLGSDETVEIEDPIPNRRTGSRASSQASSRGGSDSSPESSPNELSLSDKIPSPSLQVQRISSLLLEDAETSENYPNLETVPESRCSVDNSGHADKPVLRPSYIVRLEVNEAYNPAGGPEYVKTLGKYGLLAKGDRCGPVLRRFVNYGSSTTEKPQIIELGGIPPADQQFLASIRIGSPPQVLRVEVCTGSSDFWVFSSLLKPSHLKMAREKHNIFDHAKSKTWNWPAREWGGLANPLRFKRKALGWDIEYGDGLYDAAGVIGYDGVELGNLKLPKQAVQLARFSQNFHHSTADGILGLGFGHLNTVRPYPVSTPLETMITQMLLPEQLFTINLNTNHFVSFGFVDEETRAGREVHWVEVDSRQGFWSFSTCYASIGSERYSRLGGRAIADTASSVILTDPEITRAIYSQIEGAMYDVRQPGWCYPKASKVPKVSFSVGDDTSCMILIKEENMNHSSVSEGYVFGAIQENPAYQNGGLQIDIFGMPFFREVYAIFDIEEERFGVTKQSPSR